MKRAKARTNTKPTTRILSHPYERIWAYRHSKISEDDLDKIAKAFGVPPETLVETAVKLANG